MHKKSACVSVTNVEYQKAKSAAKQMQPAGEKLDRVIGHTMGIIKDMVGGTCGPGGKHVLIERDVFGVPPMVTKDGVTVFRAIGFMDALQQIIMEITRDAAIRTADEAGDGTTTATILSEAFVRYTQEYRNRNPSISPQSIVREIQAVHRDVLAPALKKLSIKTSLDTQKGRKLLHNVAKISANGDDDLARAVMECYDICGDAGNVTISEGSGPPSNKVTKVVGYPISMGYEESCQRFYPEFINRVETQQVLMDNPMFLLNFGRVNSTESLLPIIEKIQEGVDAEMIKTHNIVVVALGFSESVLNALRTVWRTPGAVNVFPLVVPFTPQHNGQRLFLDDLAAVTGAEVLDPLNRSLETASYEDIGNLFQNETTGDWETAGVTGFECGRYRSTIFGFSSEELLTNRVEIVRAQMLQSPSKLDTDWNQERMAKLSGGIAQLQVIGSSSGEVKERRDRAEDAICAVRGALRHGAIVGGGYGLAYLSHIVSKLPDDRKIIKEIVIPSLQSSMVCLYENVGLNDEQITNIIDTLVGSIAAGIPQKDIPIYDVSQGKWVPGLKTGIFDSLPAVSEALRNSISIATLMGTCGGLIAQARDMSLDKAEALSKAEWDRNANFNPADERI